jgi:hypothetical protein
MRRRLPRQLALGPSGGAGVGATAGNAQHGRTSRQRRLQHVQVALPHHHIERDLLLIGHVA